VTRRLIRAVRWGERPPDYLVRDIGEGMLTLSNQPGLTKDNSRNKEY
jgi:hypothetical protein